MKRINLLFCCLLVLLWSMAAQGAPPLKAEFGLYKSATQADIDYQTYIDANQLLMFVTNQGSFAYDNGAMFGKADGLYFPRGTSLSVIYAGGLWLGGMVGGDLRVSLAEYSHTYWPGPMVSGTFVADANTDHQYRVYKISKDLLNQGFYDGERPSAPDEARQWDDYHEWPADMGAPVDGEGNPKIIGDQTLWSVYNDADPSVHTNSAGSAEGLGVEVQQTTFAFNRTGSLGQCLFIDFRFINKSDETIENMYASVWADPDLGDAGDDFVGCDTFLSLGYCYNATNNDANYGSTPPATGYDFFQGPIVSGEETDSVFFLDQWRYGVKSLPMTSFAKYINGTDPDNAQETYWYMQGLDAKNGGVPIKDDDGIETKYMLAGDPVTATGWVDGNPNDRRFMQSTGPFTMEPNDTQQVVVAVLVGQGSDRLTSVTALKFNDLFAQSAFDAQFILPDPPARPVVTATPGDGSIILHWDDASEIDPGDYPFQGYNIYQGESVAGPWKRVATYDLNDGTGIIFDMEFVAEDGAVVDHPVQFGSDTGIKRFIELTQDAWRGGPLHNVFDYYWAVTAYSYDPDKTPKTLENAQEAITMSPQKPAGGYVYPLDYAEVITDISHPTGVSTINVVPRVVDPEVLNGHEYEITFEIDTNLISVDTTWSYVIDSLTGDTISSDIESIDTAWSYPTYWNFADLTDDEVLITRDDLGDDQSNMITDGIQVRVYMPTNPINSILEIAGPGGEVNDPPEDVAEPNVGSQGYFISSDTPGNFSRFNYRGLIGVDDWEIRFTAGGSEYYNFDTDTKWANRAPFEVWNIGSGTPDDDSDDRRLQFTIIDDDGSGGWSFGDRIYVIELDYYEPLPEDFDFAENFPQQFHIGRIIVNDVQPAEGTIFRFTTNKPPSEYDVFTFSTPEVFEQDMAADAAYDMSHIKVVPNPYFNKSLYEPDQFDRRIKFTNLPYQCTIKVFTLAGDHVVTLEKEAGDDSYYTWDMLSQHGLPLASGLYIYIVTAPDGGEFVGKFAIFTEVEQLDTF